MKYDPLFLEKEIALFQNTLKKYNFPPIEGIETFDLEDDFDSFDKVKKKKKKRAQI